MSASGYPVHVDAVLDPRLSRWMWLVKWFLAIPHFVILAGLWMAFALVSVAALLAIVVTGRYPRSLFEFNVGVLRWSWRVAYYSYAVLGTDRYPPFTLDEVEDYPAHLTVEYPERLSRGLVLVKWWLLAIPHYIVVGLLMGGVYWSWSLWSDGDERMRTGGGLIALLVLIAALALLFTGRYPRPLYDVVLGLNRWVLRVAAYAALMTDQYPPFRVDLGGPETAGGSRTALLDVPAASTALTAPSDPPAEPSVEWSVGRIVAAATAGVLLMVAGGLLAGGGALVVTEQSSRDADGFVMTRAETISTSTYAVVSEPVVVESAPFDGNVPRAVLGEVRLRAAAPSGHELFVGVAPAADLEDYLADVSHASLVGFGETTDAPKYRAHEGGAPPSEPAAADIWTATASGAGALTLTWEPGEGDWAALVMNADASPGVHAEVAVGATVPILGWVTTALLVNGGLLLLISLVVLYFAVRRKAGPA